jgi:predicted nuclease of predicted toxin-antitoxin system
VRFLVDANLSPRVAEWLRDSGYGALHVVDLGLAAARDREIFEHAAGEGWTVLTSALDFGDILARAGGSGSVVIMRLRSTITARTTTRLDSVLPQVVPVLEKRAVVIVEEARVRVRRLPLGHGAHGTRYALVAEHYVEAGVRRRLHDLRGCAWTDRTGECAG